MAFTRRWFLGAAGLAAAGATVGPRFRVRRAAGGGGGFGTKRVVIVGIAGGLRLKESLGMEQGATMPNLFGNMPLVGGGGAAGPARIAPEYAAMMPQLVLPAPRSTPIMSEGTLITNLRYAEGAPGHLQGQACLVSGLYNNLENRADARLPTPTLFELHRRHANAPATDAWYLSVPGGFYRALQASDHPDYGAAYGGSFLSPPAVMSPLVPIVTSGERNLALTPGYEFPTVPNDPDETAAVHRLTSILDGNTPDYPPGTDFRATPEENAAFEDHMARLYADGTYDSYYPDAIGIGLRKPDGGLDSTADSLTIYHAERILDSFKPAVMAITLIDIDACHQDFNGYLRGQLVADACVRHLWEFIQSTDGLRDETTLLVLPEHGRHLFYNGQNPDSLGRSGIDHGQGDDGDRNTWVLGLGPDFRAGEVIAPTNVDQTGRTSGRYETIDVTMTAASLLGYGEPMRSALEDADARPGLAIEEMLQ